MEVHHHAHTSRKKWTHYFWEFLMLFLAVFCGFLAENFREHQVEHRREKQYMKSFVNDLQNDTALLNMGNPRKGARVISIDSILDFFKASPKANVLPGYIVRKIRRSTFDAYFRRTSATNDQLKNAGGLRLIRNKMVADSIAAYDQHWQHAEFFRESYIIYQENGKEFMHKILPANAMLFLYRMQTDYRDWSVIDTLQFKINTEYLNEFLNFLGSQKFFTIQDIKEYESIEQSAERLIALIKKEYRLQ